jgi:hypothetical protein
MSQKTFPLKNFLISLIVVAGVMTACQATKPESAVVSTVAPTNTPRPTETPTPTDTPTAAPTNTPAPTHTPSPTPDLTATAQAYAAATAEAEAALVRPDLEKIGLSTDGGYLGWKHDPLTIKVDTYMEERPEIDYPEFVAADFVLQTDTTHHRRLPMIVIFIISSISAFALVACGAWTMSIARVYRHDHIVRRRLREYAERHGVPQWHYPRR